MIDTELLKNKVLRLAVQGKLVKQTYGNVQLADNATQEQLTKKSNSKLSEISDEEKAFELPQGWKWVRLGDIGYTNIGLTYKPTDITDSKEGTLVLRSSNIQNGKLDYIDSVYVSCEIPDSKKCLPGDILICARNGSKKLVGKSAIIDKEGMSFGAFMAIYRSEHNEYINLFLNSDFFKAQLGDANTVTINQITQNMLKNVVCPLPPTEEQKAIVEKVNNIFDEIDKLDRDKNSLLDDISTLKDKAISLAIQGRLINEDSISETASSLLDSIAQLKGKAFESVENKDKLFTIPQSWQWTTMGNIIEMCKNLNIHSKLAPTTLINYLDIESIDNKNYKIGETKLESVQNLSSRARRMLEKDMIVYSLVRPYLNNIAIIESDKENFIGSTGLVAFKTTLVNNKYVFYYLLSPYVRHKFLDLISGFNSPSISIQQFLNLEIPIPPKKVQDEIVEKLDEITALCNGIVNSQK